MCNVLCLFFQFVSRVLFSCVVFLLLFVMIGQSNMEVDDVEETAAIIFEPNGVVVIPGVQPAV